MTRQCSPGGASSGGGSAASTSCWNSCQAGWGLLRSAFHTGLARMEAAASCRLGAPSPPHRGCSERTRWVAMSCASKGCSSSGVLAMLMKREMASCTGCSLSPGSEKLAW